jgi:hypothetical protein
VLDTANVLSQLVAILLLKIEKDTLGDRSGNALKRCVGDAVSTFFKREDVLSGNKRG